MLEHVETMFDGMPEMLKKLKKASYEKNMESFRARNGHFFQEMTEYMEQREDAEEAAGEIAAAFTDAVKQAFSVRGKIKSRTQADLNFFMIYYVFPAILLTGHACADQIAKSLCSVWGDTFKDSRIGYTDYNTLYKGFKEKIFGIF